LNLQFQIYTVDLNNGEDCARKFKSNKNLGLMFWFMIIAANLMKKENEDERRRDKTRESATWYTAKPVPETPLILRPTVYIDHFSIVPFYITIYSHVKSPCIERPPLYSGLRPLCQGPSIVLTCKSACVLRPGVKSKTGLASQTVEKSQHLWRQMLRLLFLVPAVLNKLLKCSSPTNLTWMHTCFRWNRSVLKKILTS